MIFKNEAWTLNMLRIKLLHYNTSETLIIGENGLILGHLIYRRLLMRYHILNIGVFRLRQKEDLGSILLKDFLGDLENISSVFQRFKKVILRLLIYRKNYSTECSSALMMN